MTGVAIDASSTYSDLKTRDLLRSIQHILRQQSRAGIVLETDWQMLCVNFNSVPAKCGVCLLLKLIGAGNEHLPMPYQEGFFFLAYSTTHCR